MKKELLLSLTFAASFNCFADWQDTANVPPEAPPEELAARAAAAAPGATPAAENTVALPTSITQSVPAPAPAPTPAQVEVQQAPVSAPVDDIRTLAPVAPISPVQRMPKSTAIILHPSILRTRPTSTGTGDPIDSETRVRMESSVTNSDGTWWFVTATGIGGGWLLESELGDPQN